jgi:hypothetical protein
MSICKLCKTELIVGKTWTNALAKIPHYRCRACISANRKEYYLENKTHIRNRINTQRRTAPENQMLTRCKNRAKELNIEFNLELEDIVFPVCCPVFNTKLEYAGLKPENRYSIDRIDSTKGYIKGNIQIISQLANTMKSNATKEQLIMFANWIKPEVDELLISRYAN